MRDGRSRSWPSAENKGEAVGETDPSLGKKAVVMAGWVETDSQEDLHTNAGNLLLQCSLMVSTTMPR